MLMGIVPPVQQEAIALTNQMEVGKLFLSVNPTFDVGCRITQSRTAACAMPNLQSSDGNITAG